METQEKFLLGALIGGAIGATAALMLAPTSGSNLRRKIINGIHSTKSIIEKEALHKKPSNRHKPNNLPSHIEKERHHNKTIAKRKKII